MARWFWSKSSWRDSKVDDNSYTKWFARCCYQLNRLVVRAFSIFVFREMCVRSWQSVFPFHPIEEQKIVLVLDQRVICKPDRFCSVSSRWSHLRGVKTSPSARLWKPVRFFSIWVSDERIDKCTSGVTFPVILNFSRMPVSSCWT